MLLLASLVSQRKKKGEDNLAGRKAAWRLRKVWRAGVKRKTECKDQLTTFFGSHGLENLLPFPTAVIVVIGH